MNAALPAPVSAVRADVHRLSVAVATDRECESISRLRHEVYALELGQHPANGAARLSDALDGWNVNLLARLGDEIAGFISITPPGQPSYSVDKYFAREALPFPVDERLFEVRLLTVVKQHRGREVATLLMYAALRWVESQGGSRIVAIGRREVVELYHRLGLRSLGLSTRSGAVTYDLLVGEVVELRRCAGEHQAVLDRLADRTDWHLPIAFRRPASCFHGGAFFSAIGEGFEALDRRHAIINADVLDAWFDPAPGVLAALQQDLPWLLRTSPPTACAGFIDAVARARGVRPDNILPGAGSSDLIFRTVRTWLSARSHVLILDPTYGEYAHVLEQVIGCTVDRLTLSPEEGYAVNLRRLEQALADRYDLVVLVNPNSPTGRHVPREQLEAVLRGAPPSTRLWIDETYVEYAGPHESLERFAARSENVVVCKSMSKVYALSGVRAAYLCASPHQLEELRAITPPWVMGLPAQLASVRALEAPEYYSARYRETAAARETLAAALRQLGWSVLPGIANFVLCFLPECGPDAESIVRRCREEGIFLRNAAAMGRRLGDRAIRIAVKDRATTERIAAVIRQALAK